MIFCCTGGAASTAPAKKHSELSVKKESRNSPSSKCRSPTGAAGLPAGPSPGVVFWKRARQIPPLSNRLISLSYHKRREKEIGGPGKFHLLLQLGGPYGELGAATRYLSQRYAAPWGQVKAGLTDIGTEELAHIEIVSAILYQLTRV